MAKKYCSATQSYSHIAGCGCGPPWEPAPSGRARRTASRGRGTDPGGRSTPVPKAPKGHAHNYRPVGKPYTDEDRDNHYVKQAKHCGNAGCNQPDYTEVLATVPKKKQHEHIWSPTPSEVWTKGRTAYARYPCIVKGCTETKTDHT